MAWWLLGVTLAVAGRWDGEPTDVVVTRTVPEAPEAVHGRVSDLGRLAAAMPDACATEWELADRTAGLGARARVLYTFGPLRRRLTAVVVDDEPGRLFRVDHPDSRKGFFTQVTYEPFDGGTRVTLQTPLNPPPWPFKGPFYKKVLPAWTTCYEQMLTTLVEAS